MNEKMGALFVTLFLGVFIVIGAMISFMVQKKQKFLDFSLAFAFSVILMLLFTDLLPEASETLGNEHFLLFLLFIIGGIFVLRILDFFIPDHEEKRHTKKCEKDNLFHIGFIASIALVLHNIIEGMAIYSTCISSLRTGIIISLGVGCHNIPLGMVITSTLYQNNQSKKKILMIILGLMLSTFVGGMIMFFMNGDSLNEIFVGTLLSLTIGMLIYICTNELYPKIRKSNNKRTCIYGILAGVILITFTCFLGG